MKVLIVEDDRELCQATAKQLVRAGYQVQCAYDGEEAEYYVDMELYDVILLDRMLPMQSGTAVLSYIRAKHLATPVIMLTALGSISDRICGLDAGADDYLVKPYEVEELLARIRAILRRPRERMEEKLSFGDLILEEEKALLKGKSETRSLSKKELILLDFLMRNANQVLSREQILSRVWGLETSVEDGNIDNYIYFLRRKLKALSTGVQITTVHGIGYRLEQKP